MTILKLTNKDLILKYNFRALMELDKRGIQLTREDFSMTDIVTLVHIGLASYQKDIKFEDTVDLMDEILQEYTLEELMGFVAKGIQDALGKQKPNLSK